MGLRDRRDERREERRAFGRGGSAARFQMRQKLLSLGDDYWIEDEYGDRVFKVDGKALRLREPWTWRTRTERSCAASRPGAAHPGHDGDRGPRRATWPW